MAEFESLSPAAQRAMQFARAAAERMNHDRIGTENLLLGIVEERQDLAVYLLNLLDVRLKPLVELILATVEQDGPYAGELAFTDHAKAAFDNAELARKQFGHAQVGTVHLLFGVLDVETCRAVSILKRMQVDVDELRAALQSLYLPDGNRPPMGPILEKIRDVRLELGDLEHAPIHVEMSEDDLTGRAKLIVGLARNCARSLNHESVGTDHLLVSLITDRYSAAADVLTRMGLTEKRAILAVRFARGLASSDRPPSKKGMSLSPRAQNALARARFAVRQAQSGREEPQRLAGRQQKQLVIGSGDLLVGLLEEHRGAANAILSSFELDEDEIRNKLRAHGVWRSLVARPRANEPATLWEWTNQQLNRRLWSLGDLQHHSGIARSSVRRWIRGDQRPSGDSCDALAAALGGHPNTVRRLAGRAPIHAGEVRPGSLGAIHALVDRVAWSDERIARITSLLNTMIGNEGDQRPIKGHDLPPPEVT